VRLARDPRGIDPQLLSVPAAHVERFGRTVALTLVLVVSASLIGWKLFSTEPANGEHTTLELPSGPQAANSTRTHSETLSTLRAATQVQRDERRIPTRVVGPDPKSVLLAACEAVAPERRLALIDVRASFPPAVDARLGIVRDVNSNEILVLHLQRDRASGRWVTGDGVTALAPSEPSSAVLRAIALR
jgi:hypothetical protein